MLITQKATEYIKNPEKDCTAEKGSDDMIRQFARGSPNVNL